MIKAKVRYPILLLWQELIYKGEISQTQAKQKEKSKEKTESKESTTVVTIMRLYFFSICEEECVDLAYQNLEFAIDSGTSYHVIPRKNFFTSLHFTSKRQSRLYQCGK